MLQDVYRQEVEGLSGREVGEEFVKQADAEKNSKAARSFKGAMAAEKEHAKFYEGALDNLESWKAEQKTFLVCTVCGFTTADLGLKQCPVCTAPRNKFLEIT